MPQVSFGVRIPNSGPLASLENMVDASKVAESVGFDSIWVHDHTAWSTEMHRKHVSSGASEAVLAKQTPDFFEPLTTLAYLSAVTKKVDLGVAVLVVPLKNPVHTAKQVANLDVLSNGRFLLGVGIGSPATIKSRDYELLNVDRSKRGKIADEYIQAMKAIWTENSASFHGEYVSFSDAEIFPKPVQKPHPPILVGGWKKGALERAARLGDGWIPAWYTAEEIKEKISLLYERAAFYGRGKKRFITGIELSTCLAKTDEEARRRGLPTIEAGIKTYERDLTIEGHSKRSIIGGPATVHKQVEAYVDAGVTEFELKPIYSSMAQLTTMMEDWSRAIISSYK